MKSFLLYVLATLGLAALTCVAIVIIAPPNVAEETEGKPSFGEVQESQGQSSWMAAFKAKMRSLASLKKSKKPAAPVDEVDPLDETNLEGPDETDIEVVERPSPYRKKDGSAFADYTSPSVYGGKIKNSNSPRQSPKAPLSAGAFRLTQFLSSGGSGGFGGGFRGGSGGGGVIASQGDGGGGNSGYRELLIEALLRSLNEKELQEIVENQEQRASNPNP